MDSVIDILETLESNNSRLFKEDLLENCRKNNLLRQVFLAAGDPYVNYYVSKFKMPKAASSSQSEDETVAGFLALIGEKLSTREVTGNAAKELVTKIFGDMSAREQKWCLRILLKNLRCGVQATTLNKIWPDLIKGFSVQLAASLRTHHEPNRGIVIDDPIRFPIRVEPKLDGLRCVAVKSNGTVTMFTRNGTVLETLPRIKAALEAAPWDNYVLDGEGMGSDWNESASVIMSHKYGKDDSGIIFNVFDAMTLDEWRSQESHTTLSERVDLVSRLVSEVGNNCVRQVPGSFVENIDQLLTEYSNATGSGYEGVMLKDLSSPYHFKRADNIKKMKPVTTYEGIIMGHYEGHRGSKREGRWGGFEVLLPNKVITRVGSGFTDKLRAEIELDPESWIGRIVELEGQPDPMTSDGLTSDGRVRFPVYVRERDPSDVDPKVAQMLA